MILGQKYCGFRNFVECMLFIMRVCMHACADTCMRARIHACIFEGKKTGVRYVSIILYHIFLVEDEHISIQYLFHPLVLLYYFHGQI